MSKVPEHIKAMKPPSSEVQEIKGHYYVYAVKAKYNKETKKSTSQRLGCIGKIYDGVGFVPNDKGRAESVGVTKEYGATRTILVLTEKLYEMIRKHFPSEFLRIYILSVLKLMDKDLTARRIDWAYERSALSILFPEVHLSKNTVTAFMEKMSLWRGDMVTFMRALAPEGGSVIFDGTSMMSTAKDNPYCEKGYTPGVKNKKQIRLIYAFDITTRRPIYFNVVPGSVSDMTSLLASFIELGLRNCVLVLDNGFFCDDNIKTLLAADDTKFILPLKDNTTLVKAEHKPFIAYKDVIESNFTYHNRFIFHRELECGKYADCRIIVYYDERRNKDLEKEKLKKANKFYDGRIPREVVSQLHKECEMLGVTMLLTNKESDAEAIYLDYKARWAIEEMFDTMKNSLSFNMNYEVKYETQMGWAFIEFISLLMHFEINKALTDSNLHRSYDVGDILFDLKSIEQTNYGSDGSWKLANLTKRRKDLIEKLGVSLELISAPTISTHLR